METWNGRYISPSKWKRSVPTNFHDLERISWGIIFSFFCSSWYFWHVRHLLMIFSVFSFIPGQYTHVLTLRILFPMTWCDAWILFRISFLMVLGINTLPPFSTKESSTDSSSLNGQNGLIGAEVSLALSGHPTYIYSLSADTILSFLDSFSSSRLCLCWIAQTWFLHPRLLGCCRFCSVVLTVHRLTVFLFQDGMRWWDHILHFHYHLL